MMMERIDSARVMPGENGSEEEELQPAIFLEFRKIGPNGQENEEEKSHRREDCVDD